MSSALILEEAPHLAAVPEPEYSAKCHSCGKGFDALAAAWCDCVVPLRTLVCRHCSSCFCRAPLPYKRRFWSGAPRKLQQNPRRFMVQLAGAPALAVASHSQQITAASHRPLVLVVDDDEPMKSLVACFVEQLGYRVMSSSDPAAALSMSISHDADVIITDALMPRMDGREMCRRIKSTPEGARKKVIVMTSLYKSRVVRNEAFDRFGVDEMVTKPVDFMALAKLLDRLAPIRTPVRI